MLILNFTCYIEIFILIGLIWSAAVPSLRIWPPPSRASFKFWISWSLVILVFLGLLYLAISDFNNWIIGTAARYFLGIPVFIIGALYSAWSLAAMGGKNTVGLQNRLITTGPYQFCRNPQYVGDILILIGAMLFVNSVLFIVPALLGVLCFWLMPLTEEVWLRERYGMQYEKYLNKTSRFI